MPVVVPLTAKTTSRHPEVDMALRRQAVQIVAQLPQDEEEAQAVLDYAKSLVRLFLGEPRPV